MDSTKKVLLTAYTIYNIFTFINLIIMKRIHYPASDDSNNLGREQGQ